MSLSKRLQVFQAMSLDRNLFSGTFHALIQSHSHGPGPNASMQFAGKNLSPEYPSLQPREAVLKKAKPKMKRKAKKVKSEARAARQNHRLQSWIQRSVTPGR